MVEQIAVRVGIVVPALLQSIAREGLRIPDHGWAWAATRVTMIRSPTSQATRRVPVLLDTTSTELTRARAESVRPKASEEPWRVIWYRRRAGAAAPVSEPCGSRWCSSGPL